MNWFLPLLQQYGASPINICTECGTEITDGSWGIVNGVAYLFHNGCDDRIKREIDADNQQRAEEAQGCYFSGALGALFGSLMGSIVCSIFLSLGYMASVVGLLIGFLAEKGYNLLRGKQGKAKVLILIIAIILGVVIGTLAADVYTAFTMIQRGELPGVKISEIPQLLLMLLQLDADYLRATIVNMLAGLFFASLVVISLLVRAGKDVSDTRFVELR